MEHKAKMGEIVKISFCFMFPFQIRSFPAGIYLLKVNNRNTRTRCEICSNLTIKTPEWRQWRGSGVFIVDFEHISQLVLVFLLWTLNILLPARFPFLWRWPSYRCHYRLACLLSLTLSTWFYTFFVCTKEKNLLILR